MNNYKYIIAKYSGLVKGLNRTGLTKIAKKDKYEAYGAGPFSSVLMEARLTDAFSGRFELKAYFKSNVLEDIGLDDVSDFDEYLASGFEDLVEDTAADVFKYESGISDDEQDNLEITGITYEGKEVV